MKLLTFIATMAILLFCSACSTDNDMMSYGEGVSVSETTPISALLADPESWVGKTVRVEGTIADVCLHKGCWIEISGESPGEKIKLKVEDDVIVFPAETKGKTAIAQGEVYKIELDEDRAMAYAAHLAEEQGLPFDSSSVSGPMVIYQLKGQGALVAR